MACSLDLTDDQLVVTITGWDRAWCLASEVRVPLTAITDARTIDRLDAVAEIGWRTGGTYWPGRVAKGHYTVRGRKGARQFWCVRREHEVLAIDTDLARPARIVLGLPAAEARAAVEAILDRTS